VAVSSYDAQIHQGALAPYAFRYDVTSADPVGFDLSTVTSAVFSIRRENGNPDTWPAVVDVGSQTSSFVRLTHVFAAGDVDQLEVLTITPVLTTGSGDFYAQSKRLQVKEAADL